MELHDLSTSELIEKFDESNAQYIRIFKELHARNTKGELSAVEYDEIQRLSESTWIAVIELGSKDKKSVLADAKKAAEDMVEKAFSKNR